MAGHIYRTVTQKSIQTVVPLYKALVRPHLDYCSLVWSPYLKDILSIEKVQRRVTKMIPSISALTYEEHLKRTGLIPLENRRLRADLLEVFKILKGFVKVDPATHFSMSDRRSRGLTLKLEMPRSRLELRKHFFSNWVIDAWNALPGHMVEATSTNMFKAALQRLPHGAFKSWKQLPAPRGHLTTWRMASQVNHSSARYHIIPWWLAYSDCISSSHSKQLRDDYSVVVYNYTIHSVDRCVFQILCFSRNGNILSAIAYATWLIRPNQVYSLGCRQVKDWF